jgi:protein transport protein SEC61 subunit alpha
MPLPQTLKEAILDPIRTAVSIAFMLSACALFSNLDVSGSGPRDMAKQLKDQQMVVAGYREGSMYKELKRVIRRRRRLVGRFRRRFLSRML